jgi:hypothetical protein
VGVEKNQIKPEVNNQMIFPVVETRFPPQSEKRLEMISDGGNKTQPLRYVEKRQSCLALM